MAYRRATINAATKGTNGFGPADFVEEEGEEGEEAEEGEEDALAAVVEAVIMSTELYATMVCWKLQSTISNFAQKLGFLYVFYILLNNAIPSRAIRACEAAS